MTVPERFEIICYFARAGAHATIPFKNQEEYDAAKTFLDKLNEGRFGRSSEPMVYPDTETLFYFLDSKDQEAFDSFMRQIGQGAD